MTRTPSVLAGILVALAPAAALAAPQARPFDPSAEWRPTEFPFESGFIPASGPLRVNIGAAAFQEALIEMTGDANYDFETTLLDYAGLEDGGLFRNRLGAEVTVTIAINALGIETEFEIGVWDINEDAELVFDPYVLPGNPVRPITVAEQIGPFQLVEQPFMVLGLNGVLEVDYAFEVPGISFSGIRIDLDDVEGEGDIMVTHDLENEQLPVVFADAEPEGTVAPWAQMHGVFSSSLVLHVYPTVTVNIGGAPITIGPFDVAVEYPVLTDEPVPFDDRPLLYDVPALPDPDPTTTDDGGADESGGADETGGADGTGDASATADGGADESTGPSEGTGGGSAGFEGESADGCGCASSRQSPLGALLLGVVVLGARRRRRS